MKKRLTLVTLCSLFTVSMLVQPALAQQSVSDAQIQRIQQNCSDALGTIQQIHANDAPLRVNRGQTYDSVSSKLMTPLNSRLIVNRLDASALVKITAQYDKALTDFRTNYIAYDRQMSLVLSVDCRKQPDSFYNELQKARQLREAVHTNVSQLHQLITDYDKAVDVFRGQLKAGNAKGEN